MTNLLTLSFVGRTGEVRLIWGDKEEEERERERERWMGDGWQICGEVVRILLRKSRFFVVVRGPWARDLREGENAWLPGFEVPTYFDYTH